MLAGSAQAMQTAGLRLPEITATIGLPSGYFPIMTTLTFEDFTPGHFGRFGPRRVTREEILAFAAEFILIVFRINEHLGAIRDQGQMH